jgi:hypothetical protein
VVGGGGHHKDEVGGGGERDVVSKKSIVRGTDMYRKKSYIVRLNHIMGVIIN